LRNDFRSLDLSLLDPRLAERALAEHFFPNRRAAFFLASLARSERFDGLNIVTNVVSDSISFVFWTDTDEG
jgi:hypothetical protein